MIYGEEEFDDIVRSMVTSNEWVWAPHGGFLLSKYDVPHKAHFLTVLMIDGTGNSFVHLFSFINKDCIIDFKKWISKAQYEKFIHFDGKYIKPGCAFEKELINTIMENNDRIVMEML